MSTTQADARRSGAVHGPCTDGSPRPFQSERRDHERHAAGGERTEQPAQPRGRVAAVVGQLARGVDAEGDHRLPEVGRHGARGPGGRDHERGGRRARRGAGRAARRRAAPLVSSSTAASTKTSTRLCLTRAAERTGHSRGDARGRSPRVGAGWPPRPRTPAPDDHERQPEQLAVHHAAAEQRRRDADRRGPGGEQGSGAALGGGEPAQDARQDDGQHRRERPEQPQRDGAAQRVGHVEERDQPGRPVDPVVAVQAAARRSTGRRRSGSRPRPG